MTIGARPIGSPATIGAAADPSHDPPRVEADKSPSVLTAPPGMPGSARSLGIRGTPGGATIRTWSAPKGDDIPRLPDRFRRDIEYSLRQRGSSVGEALVATLGPHAEKRINPTERKELEAIAADVARTGGPRLTERELLAAEDAIRKHGEPPERAALWPPDLPLHPEDRARLDAVYAETARAGGPRLTDGQREDAEVMIELGLSVEDALAAVVRPGTIINPDDKAHLQKIAGQKNGTGGLPSSVADE